MTETLDSGAETPTSPAGALHRLCLNDTIWVGRYHGWDELGRGGSAHVVRTFSRSAGAEVALKIFPHLSEDDVRRFQREVKNAQRLASPFVVRTFSPFLRDGFAWIEMELVDGPNLRHELERRGRDGAPYGFQDALAVALCIADAVECAHGCGVIHRDVKPANVLIPRSGEPRAKLGDFGVSRVADSTRATATGLLPGTPQFVAPEVIDGREASAASDVYSLCLTLHLLFTGGRPALAVAEGATPAQWLRAQVAEPPIPIRRHDASLPPALEELLLLGLAKDPQQRPTSAEVRATLASLLAPGTVRRAVFRRNGSTARPFVWGAVAGLALGAAGAAFVTRPDGTPARLVASAVEGPAVAERRPEATRMEPTPAAASTPARVTLPPATPVVAAPAPVLTVRLSALGRDSVSVENDGTTALDDVRIALVGSSGERAAASVPTLGAGEDVTLGFGAFSPMPGRSFVVRTVEVDARTASGRLARTLEPPRASRPRP